MTVQYSIFVFLAALIVIFVWLVTRVLRWLWYIVVVWVRRIDCRVLLNHGSLWRTDIMPLPVLRGAVMAAENHVVVSDNDLLDAYHLSHDMETFIRLVAAARRSSAPVTLFDLVEMSIFRVDPECLFAVFEHAGSSGKPLSMPEALALELTRIDDRSWNPRRVWRQFVGARLLGVPIKLRTLLTPQRFYLDAVTSIRAQTAAHLAGVDIDGCEVRNLLSSGQLRDTVRSRVMSILAVRRGIVAPVLDEGTRS